ncbi:hypothetical protein L1887_18083 [Cichorium endivia]|nr:hypothetical protein L1887_18083 [Cichorium endivia]
MAPGRGDRNGVPIGPKGGVYWFYSYPPGLYKSLMQIKNNYGDPDVYITENGWPDENNNDIKLEEARLDSQRVDYYNTHLQSLRDAIRDGIFKEGSVEAIDFVDYSKPIAYETSSNVDQISRIKAPNSKWNNQRNFKRMATEKGLMEIPMRIRRLSGLNEHLIQQRSSLMMSNESTSYKEVLLLAIFCLFLQ